MFHKHNSINSFLKSQIEYFCKIFLIEPNVSKYIVNIHLLKYLCLIQHKDGAT